MAEAFEELSTAPTPTGLHEGGAAGLEDPPEPEHMRLC